MFWPLIYAKISFPFNVLRNKWTEFHQILYKHFWHICTRDMAVDLRHKSFPYNIFRIFVLELWPLIYSKISFPLNILRTNGQILTKLYITIYTNKIYIGIVSCHFKQFCKRVMALDLCQNYVTTKYPEILWPFTACKALQRGYRQIL